MATLGTGFNNKTYILHVYRPGATGAYIDQITNFDFDSFQQTINGGLGALSIKIPKPFDNYGEGDLIAFNNRVKMVCIDIDSGPNGVIVYDGYIVNLVPAKVNGSDLVTFECYGYIAKLGKSLLRNGLNVTLPTASSAGLKTSGTPEFTGIEVTFKAIIDLYTSQSLNPIVNYNTALASVQTTGLGITYLFDKMYYLEALKRCQQAAPAGWYFFIGADNVIQFRPKPSSAIHSFIWGKDFEDISVQKNADGLANNILVNSSASGQNVLSRYEDATSEGKYDDVWLIKNDSAATDQATVDNIGAQLLSVNKNPKIKVTVDILDNNLSTGQQGYNIEMIHPGDTCKFLGFNDTLSQTFSTNMQIVTVTYYPGYATLELEERIDNIVIQAQQQPASQLTSSSLGVIGTSNVGSTPIMVGASGAPAFTNSWANAGFGGSYQVARFWKDAGGLVHLEGLIASGTVNTSAFTLPTGYRPAAWHIFNGVTGSAPNTICRININPDGTVTPADLANNAFVSLSGISFNTV